MNVCKELRVVTCSETSTFVIKLCLHTQFVSPICAAMALRGAWADHEQKKSALRGMLHTPIFLAMTFATQIGDTNWCV